MHKKIYILTTIFFILDQISKSIISTFLSLNENIVIIKNFFSINYINNKGASWGILSNARILLIVLSIICIIILFRYMNTFKINKKNILAFGMILGGILGNLSDRIFFGYVIDFLNFKIINYNFPVFNLADTFIVVGVILLITAIIKGEDKNGSKSNGRKRKN